MHVGDMFLGKTLPFIDAENGNGGSAIEFGRTLTKVIDNIHHVATIINGHWNTLLAWSDLVDYRGFYMDLYNQTRRSIDTAERGGSDRRVREAGALQRGQCEQGRRSFHRGPNR